MRGFRIDVFIVLVLLGKNDNFKNSYSLRRVLHWKFGILSDMELKEKMINNGLIIKDNSGNNNIDYNITSLGITYLKQNFDRGKRSIYDSFPELNEFLDALFDKFVI
ncbi:hypothetical protein [Pedobacter sp.]|uniref:hypothetical protein n=1 Tax=Pedobacter sp. TaxID=1411316 RepID=UPI0031D1AA1C